MEKECAQTVSLGNKPSRAKPEGPSQLEMSKEGRDSKGQSASNVKIPHGQQK
jgi:hypothetical protein